MFLVVHSNLSVEDGLKMATDEAEDVVDKLIDRIKVAHKKNPEAFAAKIEEDRLKYIKAAKEKKAITDEFKALLNKHFPKKDGKAIDNRLDAPDLLANMLMHFSFGDEDLNPKQLYLEWAVEAFVGAKMKKVAELMSKLHDICVEKGYTQENPYDYNDIDNTVFHIPVKEVDPTAYYYTRKVLCLTDQNCNFVILIRYFNSGENAPILNDMHIRKYYDAWDFEEEAKYHEEITDTLTAMKEMGNLERYSDQEEGIRYPKRLKLQSFIDADFIEGYGHVLESALGLRYGDFRDDGYVASVDFKDVDGVYSRHEFPRVDRAMYYLSEMFCVTLDAESAITCLGEDDEG